MACEGFYLRTVVPPGAVSSVVGCNLIPVLWEPTPRKEKRQAVLLKDTWLEVLTLSKNGEAPVTLCHQPVHGIARACAALPAGCGDLDALVVTSDAGTITLLYFDVEASCLKELSSHTVASVGFDRKQLGNKLAVDTRNRTVAVAALEGEVSVFSIDLEDNDSQHFPLLATCEVDGIIQSMCFLDDVALVVLSQQGDDQTVNVFPIDEIPMPTKQFTVRTTTLLKRDDLDRSDGGDGRDAVDPIVTEILAVPDSLHDVALLADGVVATFDVRPVLQRVEMDLSMIPSASIPYRVGLAIAELEEQRNLVQSSSFTIPSPPQIDPGGRGPPVAGESGEGSSRGHDQDADAMSTTTPHATTGDDNPSTAPPLCISAAWVKLRVTTSVTTGKQHDVWALVVCTENGDLFLLEKDTIRSLGNFGPMVAMTALTGGHLVLCGDGCDGAVRKMVTLADGSVRLDKCLELLNLSPISDFAFDHESKELFVCSGLGATGSLRRLQVCLPFDVVTSSAEAFVGCSGLWSVRERPDVDRFDTYLVVSFLDSTSVLKVDAEQAILTEDADNPGFVLDQSTVVAGTLEEEVAVQVLSGGVRILLLGERRIVDWGNAEELHITSGIIKRGLIILGLIKPGEGPQVAVLSFVHNSVCVVAREKLSHEASCFETMVHTDADDGKRRTLILVGTHAPDLQLFALGDREQLEQMDSVPLKNLFHGAKLPDGRRAQVSQLLRNTSIASVAPESICVHRAGKTHVVVSLRDGSLLFTSLNATSLRLDELETRHFCSTSAKLLRASLRGQKGILVLADVVWFIRFTSDRPNCSPTSLREAEFATTLSCFGAVGAIAYVAKGTLRVAVASGRSPLSTKKIPIKETPRRLLLFPSAASGCEWDASGQPSTRPCAESCTHPQIQTLSGVKRYVVVATERLSSTPRRSLLRVFDLRTNRQIARRSLNPNERVHALINFNGDIGVGTSVEGDPPSGRLYIFALANTRCMDVGGSAEDDGGAAASGGDQERSSRSGRMFLYRRTELRFSRGINAMSYHQPSNKLFVGVYETLIGLGLVTDNFAVDEGFRGLWVADLARVRTRGEIVAISTYGDCLAVADRKDSVQTFSFVREGDELVAVPERSDIRKRAMACCYLVDENFILGTDKECAFLTLTPDWSSNGSVAVRRHLKTKQFIHLGEALLRLTVGALTHVDIQQDRVSADPLLPGHALIRKSASVIGMSVNGSLMTFLPLEEEDLAVLTRMESAVGDHPLTCPLLGNVHKTFRSSLNVVDGDLLSKVLLLGPAEQRKVFEDLTTTSSNPDQTRVDLVKLVDIANDLCT